MVFSYLEPVLHKAQLVLGGGLCFKFFSYSLPRVVAMSGTQLDPLECPQSEAVPGRPLQLHRWWHSDTKRGNFRRLVRFNPQAPRELPGVSLNSCLTHGNTHWTFSSAKHPFPSQIMLDMPHPARHRPGVVGLTDWPTDTSKA